MEEEKKHRLVMLEVVAGLNHARMGIPENLVGVAMVVEWKGQVRVVLEL